MAGLDAAQDRQVRRSARVSRRLARARERNNRQLVQIREREVLVDRALRDYMAAADQVTLAEQACEDRVSALSARIGQARAERDRRVAAVEAAQAQTVVAIHLAGRTVKQVAELLELSEKATRHLIKCGRAAGVWAPAPTRPAAAGAGASDYLVPAPGEAARTGREERQ